MTGTAIRAPKQDSASLEKSGLRPFFRNSSFVPGRKRRDFCGLRIAI